MAEKIEVKLSRAFQFGELDDPYFKDIQKMNDDELALIHQFMQDVSNRKPLRGKNKPSWQYDNLNSIPNTEFYEQHNIWHYHCGPYADTARFNWMTELKLNLNGETSGAVIHYQKVTDHFILILAYSPKHDPFPNKNYRPNPMLEPKRLEYTIS